MENEEENGDGEVESNIIRPGDSDNLAETQRKLTKREKLDEKRKIEEYLDEHLPFDVYIHPQKLSLTLEIKRRISLSGGLSRYIWADTLGHPHCYRRSIKRIRGVKETRSVSIYRYQGQGQEKVRKEEAVTGMEEEDYRGGRG
jgi:hypothetical protein